MIEALVVVGIGIVTFIGVVDSLLFLVVQFGTTTFTPRLNLFRDAPIVWHAFGFFAGIMVFSFTATFRAADGTLQPPKDRATIQAVEVDDDGRARA